MSKKRKGSDERTVKLALITAAIALVTQLISLVERLIEWLANP